MTSNEGAYKTGNIRARPRVIGSIDYFGPNLGEVPFPPGEPIFRVMSDRFSANLRGVQICFRRKLTW